MNQIVMPAPDPGELSAAATTCRGLLDGIQSFYLQAATAGAPGYLEDETGGVFFDRGERCLMMQSRYLWYFSIAAQHGIAREANLAAAAHGFRFLQEAMYDTKRGGYFARVRPDGAPVDNQKDICQQGFALYALARYALATGDAGARRAAEVQFAAIDDHAHDAINGGYVERFNRAWRPLSGRWNRKAAKLLTARTLNAHMHLLEAFGDHARLAPGGAVAARIDELLDLLTVRFGHPRLPGALLTRWTSDWKPLMVPKNRRYSHGHDVELIWFVFDAARVTGIPPERYLPWAEQVMRNVVECSIDRAGGGILDNGRHGAPAKREGKEWWAQAELLVCCLELYRLNRDPLCWEIFRRTLDLVAAGFAHPDGGWRQRLDADGAVLSDKRAWEWQGPYHNGRAMLLCATMLEEMAAG